MRFLSKISQLFFHSGFDKIEFRVIGKIVGQNDNKFVLYLEALFEEGKKHKT